MSGKTLNKDYFAYARVGLFTHYTYATYTDICNASYAVASTKRGLHIGEKLVLDCLQMGRACGFTVLQFNAVVASNIHARHLYERLGFKQLGVIPKGFRMSGGRYEDICPYFCEL